MKNDSLKLQFLEVVEELVTMNQTAAHLTTLLEASGQVRRKVRASQGMMPGNARVGRSKGFFNRQRNRKYTV